MLQRASDGDLTRKCDCEEEGVDLKCGDCEGCHGRDEKLRRELREVGRGVDGRSLLTRQLDVTLDKLLSGDASKNMALKSKLLECRICVHV